MIESRGISFLQVSCLDATCITNGWLLNSWEGIHANGFPTVYPDLESLTWLGFNDHMRSLTCFNTSNLAWLIMKLKILVVISFGVFRNIFWWFRNTFWFLVTHCCSFWFFRIGCKFYPFFWSSEVNPGINYAKFRFLVPDSKHVVFRVKVFIWCCMSYILTLKCPNLNLTLHFGS